MTGAGETQIYLDLLRFKPEGMSLNAWAVTAGVSRTVWADIRRHGNPSRRTLEKLLTAAGSSLAEFEALRVEAARHGSHVASAKLGDVVRNWRSAPLAPLPLIASDLAGEWPVEDTAVQMTALRPKDVIGHVERPSALSGDADAFAVTIVGEAMWPRFRPGMRVAVSPRSPVVVGDDVLARIQPAAIGESDVQHVLVVHLVRRSASGFELRQFNPDRTFHIDSSEVEALLKVAGELI